MRLSPGPVSVATHSPGRLGSSAAPAVSPDANPASPAASPVSLAVVSLAHSLPAEEPPDVARPRTRLQNNIMQPKKLFPGMIRYGNFCATGT